MPPKKKKAPSKKGAKSEELDGMPMEPEDKIKYLESTTQALELQLAHRSETTALALEECESIRQEHKLVTQKLEDEKQMTLDVTRSMTRQYKGMQEDLLNKINERERTISTLRDEIEMLKMLHKEEIAQKDQTILQKHADAEKQKIETEDLCKNFSHLLPVARLRIVNFSRGG